MSCYSTLNRAIQREFVETVCTACYALCLKNIPNIFDCNLKTNCQILIIFGIIILDTTCHQNDSLFSNSPNVCFCTT